MKFNWIALSILILLVAGVVAVLAKGQRAGAQEIVLHARMAESGGWTPSTLSAIVGLPLRLRLTSDDVTHSFAIGQSDRPAVDVKPGEVTETTLVFDQPGKYTFYCTRWCGPNHWRMRGTIEVSPASENLAPGDSPASVKPPHYSTLGLDIDQAHLVAVTPKVRPSPENAPFRAPLDPKYLANDYYLSHSPAEAWLALRAEPGLKYLDDQMIWDLVAKIWQANIMPQALEAGKQLYSQNCAACHGENGAGDGVMARNIQDQQSMEMGHEIKKPANFSDPTSMLGASPALLQGKIIRGGMGTGMPYWGPIFTEKQTWDLVAYLWSFQFDLEVKK